MGRSATASGLSKLIAHPRVVSPPRHQDSVSPAPGLQHLLTVPFAPVTPGSNPDASASESARVRSRPRTREKKPAVRRILDTNPDRRRLAGVQTASFRPLLSLFADSGVRFPGGAAAIGNRDRMRRGFALKPSSIYEARHPGVYHRAGPYKLAGARVPHVAHCLLRGPTPAPRLELAELLMARATYQRPLLD